MKRTNLLMLLLVSLLLFGCGNTNIFNWSRGTGDDRSAQALASDGEAAYKNGDYAEAYEYYQKARDKDPNNSEILYGLAKCAYGANGIRLSSLASSFLDNLNDAESSSNLTYNAFELVSGVGELETGTLNVSSEESLIPETLNLKNLYDATKTIIDTLSQIADGKADGTIPYNDPDVNINLGIGLVLNSAMLVLDSNNDGTPGSDDDIIKRSALKKDFNIEQPTEAELQAQKSTLLPNVELAIFQLVGQTVGSSTLNKKAEKGATEYFTQAKSANSTQKTGILDDLIASFQDLAGTETAESKNLKKIYDNLVAL